MTQTARSRRPAWRHAPAIAAGAALLLAVIGTVAAAQQRATPAHVVTVTATPRDGAAAQIMTATHTITPPWGHPLRLDQKPETVSVITWADSDGASCTIVIDGQVVAEETAGGEGQPASCVWPG